MINNKIIKIIAHSENTTFENKRPYDVKSFENKYEENINYDNKLMILANDVVTKIVDVMLYNWDLLNVKNSEIFFL